MSLVFPTIQKPSYPFEPSDEDIALKSSKENGIVQTRAKFTKSRMTFKLQWNNLPLKDYYTLHEFYKNQTLTGTLLFEWTYPNLHEDDPYSGKTFVVRFTEFSFKAETYNSYKGNVSIEEV